LNINLDGFTLNILLKKYIKFNDTESIKKTINLFNYYKIEINEVTYNTLINYLIKINDKTTLNSLIHFKNNINIDKNKNKNRNKNNIINYSLIIKNYIKNDDIEKLNLTLNEMKSKSICLNIALYNSIFDYYIKCNHFDVLSNIYNEYVHSINQNLIKPNIITYRILLDGYLSNNRLDDALKIYSDYKKSGLKNFDNLEFEKTIKKLELQICNN
jgi:pentatricopeptide repeat protein